MVTILEIQHDTSLHSLLALKIWFYVLFRPSVDAQLKVSLCSPEGNLKDMGCGFFIYTTQKDNAKPFLFRHQGVCHRLKSHKCNRNSNKGGVFERQRSQREHLRVDLNLLPINCLHYLI